MSDEMKWISVKVQSPELDGLYNVFVECDEGNTCTSMWFVSENSQWHFDYELSVGEPLYSTASYVEVTHWMELPESPNND